MNMATSIQFTAVDCLQALPELSFLICRKALTYKRHLTRHQSWDITESRSGTRKLVSKRHLTRLLPQQTTYLPRSLICKWHLTRHSARDDNRVPKANRESSLEKAFDKTFPVSAKRSSWSSLRSTTSTLSAERTWSLRTDTSSSLIESWSLCSRHQT